MTVRLITIADDYMGMSERDVDLARQISAIGGRLARDDFAPSWLTLADAAGNEADIATTQGRD